MVLLFSMLGCTWVGHGMSEKPTGTPASEGVVRVGRIQDRRLGECSGMDRSLQTGDLKNAYLFERAGRDSWAAALGGTPVTIPPPLPQDRADLRQREAVCFSSDSRAIFVTSEGREAGIFRREIR